MIKKFFREWKWTIIFGIGILIVFFLLRLINLTILPIFADEAIYIRWSQVMKAEPTLRFLPLSDGKQPFFMWMLMFALGVIKNPLFTGRFLSVLAGLGSLIGIFLLSYELFKDKKTSLITSLFYAVVPFFVFFDRMALVDSLLAMFGIWFFYFGLLLIKNLRLDLAMITGMILGAALITKSPALFYAILLPTTFLFYPFPSRRRFVQKKHLLNLGKIVILWGVVYVFAFGIYNLLRLGPNFQMIAIRNKDYVFSFEWILSHPFDPLKPHLFDLAQWLPNLLTWPVLLLAVAGLVWMWLKRENWRQASWLFSVSAVPLLVQSVFAKVFTPRYILFTIWPLLIIAAYFFSVMVKKLKIKTNLLALLILLIIIPSLYYNYLLLTEPEKAPLPRRMRSGYLEEWTAGQGIREIADFIKEKAKEKNVLVGTEGSFGTLPDGLQIYLEKVPNVTVIGVGYPITGVHSSLVNSLVDNDVYLVVNQSRLQIPPEAYGLKLVGEYPKALTPEGEQDQLLFFELDREFWWKR
ncbi:glycosyltransferase family 39 protein [Patescibacteria group bacterium]|nr:glycosyltransferase family 39 protein [Patescibacteria group bacterium]